MSYGVLIRFSPACPPVYGRLHTRYSPVRRSSAAEALLPLGLHVLGLPLAFILSQDQTLHCIKYTFSVLSGLLPLFILRSVFPYLLKNFLHPKVQMRTRFLCRCPLYCFSVFYDRPGVPESGCKGKVFISGNANFFLIFSF